MMADETELVEIVAQVLECCRDPERGGWFGKVIELSDCTDSEGGDIGDWLVMIHPTRVPEGKGMGSVEPLAAKVRDAVLATGQLGNDDGAALRADIIADAALAIARAALSGEAS